MTNLPQSRSIGPPSPESPPAPRPHLDRTTLADQLLAPGSPVLVLSGPSGIGKSDLLGALQQRGPHVATTPHVLETSAGALQRGLIDQLGAAVAELTEGESRVERVSSYLADAARRLARSRAQDIARVIGKELLAVVRGRLGEHAGDAIGDYIEEIRNSYDARLEQRLAAAADPGVVALIADFADEIAALAEKRPLALALDSVDGLGEGDLSLLVDVIPKLPHQMSLRLGFATDRGKHPELARLRSAGATVAEVPPLTEDEIAQLLSAAGVNPDSAKAILRVSSGFPLHVSDAIAHLSQGRPLAEVPRSELFAARTLEAWGTLDTPVAVAARRLAAYPSAPDRRRAARIVGNVDLHAWGEIERRLLQAGVFTAPPGGQPWFHEQRRRVIWDSVLAPDDRLASGQAAFEEVQQELSSSGRLELMADLALIVEGASAAAIGGTAMVEVLGLSPGELAIMSALIELVEPEAGSAAVEGDLLLEHARRTFGANGDLVVALEGLRDLGFVHVESRADAAAVVPLEREPRSLMVLAGRASLLLGRLPIPAAASEFFQVEMQSRIGSFLHAVYGVGRASVSSLAADLDELRIGRSKGEVASGPRRPALLVRGRYRHVDVYAGIAFEEEVQRDAAARRVVTGPRSPDLEVTDMTDYPYSAVPALRFLGAAERLVRERLSGGRARLNLQSPISASLALARRSAAEAAIRRRCSPAELLAYVLEEPTRIIYRETPSGGLISVEVVGTSGLPQASDDLHWEPPDPFETFRLARRLALAPSERLGTITHTSALPTEDPVIQYLEELRRVASTYNRRATRMAVTASADELRRLLMEAQKRKTEDARALAEVLPPRHGDVLQPHQLDVVVLLDQPKPGWAPLAEATVACSERPTPGEGDEVVRVIVEVDAAETSWARAGDVMMQEFGVVPMTRGLASTVLGRLLGYDASEIHFRYPPS